LSIIGSIPPASHSYIIEAVLLSLSIIPINALSAPVKLPIFSRDIFIKEIIFEVSFSSFKKSFVIPVKSFCIEYR